MRQKKTRADTEYGGKLPEVTCVRLYPEDREEAQRRAAIERRPLAQFLRNFIHDALAAPRRTVK